jgi:phospholipase C
LYGHTDPYRRVVIAPTCKTEYSTIAVILIHLTLNFGSHKALYPSLKIKRNASSQLLRPQKMIRKLLALSLSSLLILSGCGQGIVSTPPGNGNGNTTPPVVVTPTTASTAIKHVVVIFGENISFDHYFGTYPIAANTPGEPQFTAASGTPIPNNYVSNPSLLTQNPNLAINGTANTGNGAGASNPFRLDRAQALTADQDHNYPDEQKAFDGGKMDLFPASVGKPNSAAQQAATGAPPIAATTALTMAYYDGNTVTALWNYAQHYAMNDHSFSTVFGPSTPGAINGSTPPI